jgi:carbamate kinase
MDIDPLERFYRGSAAREWKAAEERMRPALLCVDLQGLDAARDQGIFEGVPAHQQTFYFDQLDRVVLPNVQRLQRAFRVAGHEVIHVHIESLTRDGRDRGRAHKRLGLLAPPGSPAARFLPQVAPRGDEIVLSKTSSGVFESTKLEYVLRNIDINALVIVGVYTNECVSTAARVAADLGFSVTVVEDACTTVTTDLQRHALATLRDRYARIVETQQAIREIETLSDPASRQAIGRRQGARRSVVLLGGGAFESESEGLTMAGQFEFAERALERLLPLFEDGRELVIGHGNGPQVGQMLTRVEAALGEAYAIPLEVCVAESEGELGYVLQQTLHNLLHRHSIARSVVSVLTQTVVDAGDPALAKPTKPIGPCYDQERARDLEQQGFQMRTENGGWRRVVPAPEPCEIVEVDVIQDLLRSGAIVVAAGGGGMPVIRRSGGALDGIDAVVDKDLSGALLASTLGADELVILTSVPCVYLDYGSDAQRRLARATPAEIEALAAHGHFEAGTMAPKVEAARRFAESGGTTIICDVDSLTEALEGRAGTRVDSSGP